MKRLLPYLLVLVAVGVPSCTEARPAQATGNCSERTQFCDDFSGPAGAAPARRNWIKRGNDVCDNGGGIKDANAFLDGRGHLVMRIKREPRRLCGIKFSSSFIGTFNYGSGWPPTRVKASVSLPFHIEMSALMPDSPGTWAALWLMSVDRPASRNYYELDVADERMSFPRSAGCHTHIWPSNSRAWDGATSVSNMGTHWHVYSADVSPHHVSYFVDGMRCGPGSSWTVPSGRYGLLIDNIIPTGRTHTWGAGGGWPAAADPGPWDMKVDYIKVTSAPPSAAAR